MEKIPFEDGTKIKDAVVEINEQEYTVTPAQYAGTTPLTAANLNLMQDNIEEAIDDTVLGVKISENTNEHMNQYLKLFTLSFESEAYKTNSVLFKLSSVQDRSLDMLCNLLVNKSSQETGIANVLLKIVEQTGVTDNVNNLIAVRETGNTISVYLKIVSNSVTPELKIISYMKYATETLTISSEQYVDSLPSGTQYQAFSKGRASVKFTSNKNVTTTGSWASTKLPFDFLLDSNNMTFEDNSIVIGKGMRKALVILKLVTAVDTPTTIQANIYRNNSIVNPLTSIGYNDSIYTNLIAVGIINIEEGDIISGHVSFSSSQTNFALHNSSTMIITEI